MLRKTTIIMMIAAALLLSCSSQKDEEEVEGEDTSQEQVAPEEQDEEQDKSVLSLSSGGHYVRFVDHDGTTFHIRHARSVTVRNGIFHVIDARGRGFLIPQQRIIYAGEELLGSLGFLSFL